MINSLANFIVVSCNFSTTNSAKYNNGKTTQLTEQIMFRTLMSNALLLMATFHASSDVLLRSTVLQAKKSRGAERKVPTTKPVPICKKCWSFNILVQTYAVKSFGMP